MYKKILYTKPKLIALSVVNPSVDTAPLLYTRSVQ